MTPGTLYAFSVAGVPRQDADLADLYPSKILRREFGWITGLHHMPPLIIYFMCFLNCSSRSPCS